MYLGLSTGLLELHLQHQVAKGIFPKGIRYVMQGYTNEGCVFAYEFHPNQYKQGVLTQTVAKMAPEVLSSAQWLVEASSQTTIITIPCEVIIHLSKLISLKILIAMNGGECAKDNLMFALQYFKHFFESNTVHHYARQESYLRLNRPEFKCMMANLSRREPEVWRMIQLLELPEICPSHFD